MAQLIGRPSNHGRRLLSPADFTFLGRYFFDGNIGGDTSHWYYAKNGITHRIRSGELTFLLRTGTTPNNTVLREFVVDPLPTEQTLGESYQIRSWSGANNPWRLAQMPYEEAEGVGEDHFHLWWDEGLQRLWISRAHAYPGQANYRAMASIVINDNGTYSDFRGRWGLGDATGTNGAHGQRTIYGGCRKIPQWFQTLYSTQPYLWGYGGALSIASAGVSMGPFFATAINPIGVVAGIDEAAPGLGLLNTSQYKIACRCNQGGVTGVDWFINQNPHPPKPTAFDRGVRARKDFTNTAEIPPTGNWDFEGQDGFRRWTQLENYNGAVAWIDNDAGTRRRHGIVAIVSGGYGDVRYIEGGVRPSLGHFAEVQFFDPQTLGEVILFQRNDFDVKPYVTWDVTEEHPWGLHLYNPESGLEDMQHSILGAGFIPEMNWFYTYHTGAINSGGCLSIFQVRE